MDSQHIKLPSNRRFGFFFSFIFLTSAAYFYYANNTYISIGFFSLFILLIFITIINERILSPFNTTWMQLVLILGKIINPLVMGITFFGLFTPISILTMIFGRDELRINKRKPYSFWVEKKVNINNNFFFKNQF